MVKTSRYGIPNLQLETRNLYHSFSASSGAPKAHEGLLRK
jgi:hypothetical protein